ncbi:MAG: hydrogenase expression/formation protein HypE [Gammaproteobacteria bacterium]|nr:hydrogenase expression/formation protein HypE [Gammaproteobacteria bacterium]
MIDEHISLAHGNGGRYMKELIKEIFYQNLKNPFLESEEDSAKLILPNKHICFTTDGFTVQPLEFPGGTIGSLAIHGTCNDLAVAGAKPLYLTLNAFIEEGFEIAQLNRIIADMAEAANEINVKIVAGDTKILNKGEGGGLYLATTGIGEIINPNLSQNNIQAGDKILVSGGIGEHGISVMLAREQFGLRGDLQSDSGHVTPVCKKMHSLTGVKFMRDPTRGGLATVCHELSTHTKLGFDLEESQIPISDPVQAVCEMLGYDPLYLACEGRVVSIVSREEAEQALALQQQFNSQAKIIGEVTDQHQNVVIHTTLGGSRVLQELEDDPLPRIC